MGRRPRTTDGIGKETLTALIAGLAAAFFVPPTALGKIDEALITFLAIIAGASLPGMALTAAAARPPIESQLEAKRLGLQLEDQVRFWFGFLLSAGLAVVCILVGRAASWQLPIPRPHFIPKFIPEAGAWLVLAAVSTSAFAAIRLRHVVSAVLDLVRLGTAAHVAQTNDRQRRLQAEVAEQLLTAPKPEGRGSPTERRERH